MRHLILPTIVLGTIPLAVIARQTRSAMLELLSEDYICTAWGQGPFARVGQRLPCAPQRADHGDHGDRPVRRHAACWRILTETIFSWPGIGKGMADSIFRRDYPVVQGGLALIAVMVLIVNLIVDAFYGFINAKTRIR